MVFLYRSGSWLSSGCDSTVVALSRPRSTQSKEKVVEVQCHQWYSELISAHRLEPDRINNSTDVSQVDGTLGVLPTLSQVD